MQRSSLWILLFLSCGLAFAGKPGKEPAKTYTLLFIGNSLTYTNDLPKLVEQAGKSKGIRIEADMLTHADFGLEDHWNSGELPEAIANKKYDFVILQQGPSSQADGLASLLTYGAKIRTLCDSNGSKMALFMVWPSLFQYKTIDGVIQHYSDAASQLGAILCPVGEAWKENIDIRKDFSYYGPDFFHPSLKGSEAAAEVIVNSLFPVKLNL